MAEPLRYYFDEDMDPDVAGPLRERGIDVETARDVGLSGRAVPDGVQLTHAASAGRVLVTRDHDFIGLSASRIDHAGIILLHKPLSIGEMIDYLELSAHLIAPDQVRGCLLFCDW